MAIREELEEIHQLTEAGDAAALLDRSLQFAEQYDALGRSLSRKALRAPREQPWKAPSMATCSSPPVTISAAASAASTALAPLGAHRWTTPSAASSAGSERNSSSKNASRSGVGKSSVSSGAPDASTRWIASLITGWFQPSEAAPAAARQS